MRPRLIPFLLAAGALVATGCASGSDPGESTAVDLTPATPIVGTNFGPPPSVSDGPLDATVAADLDLLFGSLTTAVDVEALERLGDSAEARIAWLLTDLLQFTGRGGDLEQSTLAAWEGVTGRTLDASSPGWSATTDHLIAWDTPPPPGYINWKRQLFELIEPGWAPLFDDPQATIDWRGVAWGGVLIDDRPLNQTDVPCPESCIPALDDPGLTDAASGVWYPDDRTVFGVVVGDQAVAFPKNIMEIHEMVNMTIDGRRIGMPYCTLCGSAQAYFTDRVADGVDLAGNETYELRTSGLLSRSNKVMYEFHTRSVFDTFTGEAVAGPLREAGVTLEQITVQVTSWGDWKAAHPATQIIAEDGGIGRTYDEDPLQGRDDDGPIFPIGDIDGRLGVQAPVLGVVLDDGTAVAFAVADANAVLDVGGQVTIAGVEVTSDGGGLTAAKADTGDALTSHQAFWFAWSQFHPTTLLWTADT